MLRGGILFLSLFVFAASSPPSIREVCPRNHWAKFAKPDLVDRVDTLLAQFDHDLAQANFNFANRLRAAEKDEAAALAEKSALVTELETKRGEVKEKLERLEQLRFLKRGGNHEHDAEIAVLTHEPAILNWFEFEVAQKARIKEATTREKAAEDRRLAALHEKKQRLQVIEEKLAKHAVEIKNVQTALLIKELKAGTPTAEMPTTVVARELMGKHFAEDFPLPTDQSERAAIIVESALREAKMDDIVVGAAITKEGLVYVAFSGKPERVTAINEALKGKLPDFIHLAPPDNVALPGADKLTYSYPEIPEVYGSRAGTDATAAIITRLIPGTATCSEPRLFHFANREGQEIASMSVHYYRGLEHVMPGTRKSMCPCPACHRFAKTIRTIGRD